MDLNLFGFPLDDALDWWTAWAHWLDNSNEGLNECVGEHLDLSPAPNDL